MTDSPSNPQPLTVTVRRCYVDERGYIGADYTMTAQLMRGKGAGLVLRYEVESVSCVLDGDDLYIQ